MAMSQKQVMELLQWSEMFRSCAVCWWPSSDYRRDMEVHHIVGGPNRSKGNVPFNYLKLCDRCHAVYHSGKVAANVPDLHLGHILWAKRESDPEEFDIARLAALKGRVGLAKDPEPLPTYFLDERQRNILHYQDRIP